MKKQRLWTIATTVLLFGFGCGDSKEGIVRSGPSFSGGRLAALTPSVGSISPTFSPGTQNYTLSLPGRVESLTFIPRALDPGTRVWIAGPGLPEEGVIIDSGSPSPVIQLKQSNNVVILETIPESGNFGYVYIVNLMMTNPDENT